MKYLALTIMLCMCVFGLLLVATGLLSNDLTGLQSCASILSFTIFGVFSISELIKLEG